MGSITKSDSTADENSDLAAQQAHREATIDKLRILLEDDKEEQKETFEYLKKAIDEDRPSNRKLYE
jgi:hypothetical protein